MSRNLSGHDACNYTVQILKPSSQNSTLKLPQQKINIPM